MQKFSANDLQEQVTKAAAQEAAQTTSFVTFPDDSDEVSGTFRNTLTSIAKGKPYLFGQMVDATNDNCAALIEAARQLNSPDASALVGNHITAAKNRAKREKGGGLGRIRSQVSLGIEIAATITSDVTDEARNLKRSGAFHALGNDEKPLKFVDGTEYLPVRLALRLGSTITDFNGNKVKPLQIKGVVYEAATQVAGA